MARSAGLGSSSPPLRDQRHHGSTPSLCRGAERASSTCSLRLAAPDTQCPKCGDEGLNLHGAGERDHALVQTLADAGLSSSGFAASTAI
jgi:hypothetical protein